jgi:AAA family ATP:ADP antiporter
MASTLPTLVTGRERTRLDRALALFADVRAGEGAGALLLAANVFCLLTFYSVLKIVREALILSEGGAEIKSYAAARADTAVVCAGARIRAGGGTRQPIKLNCGVTLFFASHLLIFYVLAWPASAWGSRSFSGSASSIWL